MNGEFVADAFLEGPAFVPAGALFVTFDFEPVCICVGRVRV